MKNDSDQTMKYRITEDGEEYLQKFVMPEPSNHLLEAMQQILVMCESAEQGYMTQNDLVYCFSCPFPDTIPTSKRSLSTKTLFEWAVENIDFVLMELVERGYVSIA